MMGYQIREVWHLCVGGYVPIGEAWGVEGHIWNHDRLIEWSVQIMQGQRTPIHTKMAYCPLCGERLPQDEAELLLKAAAKP